MILASLPIVPERWVLLEYESTPTQLTSKWHRFSVSWSEFAESESPLIPEAENVTELEIFHDVFRVSGPQGRRTKVCQGSLCCLLTMERDTSDQVIIGAFRGLHTAYGMLKETQELQKKSVFEGGYFLEICIVTSLTQNIQTKIEIAGWQQNYLKFKT